jgi:hypothetical protein
LVTTTPGCWHRNRDESWLGRVAVLKPLVPGWEEDPTLESDLYASWQGRLTRAQLIDAFGFIALRLQNETSEELFAAVHTRGPRAPKELGWFGTSAGSMRAIFTEKTRLPIPAQGWLQLEFREWLGWKAIEVGDRFDFEVRVEGRAGAEVCGARFEVVQWAPWVGVLREPVER